jgi:hypothetical protein
MLFATTTGKLLPPEKSWTNMAQGHHQAGRLCQTSSGLWKGQEATQSGQHLNIKGESMKATQNTPLTKLVKRGALALGLIATTLASITSHAAPLVFETEAAK